MTNRAGGIDWDLVREKQSKMTKEETYDWLVKIGVVRPDTREILGDEREQVLTMLRLLEPNVTSNNQHSWCEDYIVGNLHYSVNTFPDGSYIVEETVIK